MGRDLGRLRAPAGELATLASGTLKARRVWPLAFCSLMMPFASRCRPERSSLWIARKRRSSWSDFTGASPCRSFPVGRGAILCACCEAINASARRQTVLLEERTCAAVAGCNQALSACVGRDRLV